MEQLTMDSISNDVLRETAESIIEKIEKYYSDENTLSEVKKILKYNGTGNIDLQFKSIHNKPKTGVPYFSLSILNRVLYHIKLNKKNLSFKTSEIWFKKKEARTIKINNFSDVELLLFDGIIKVINSRMLNLSEYFSCCSRHADCSDICSCVHPDFKLAVCCRYWEKLRDDIILYGENRNAYFDYDELKLKKVPSH